MTIATAQTGTGLRSPNPVNPMNRLDLVWSQMSSADRHALLGHDRDLLDATDKIRLAKMAAALRKQR